MESHTFEMGGSSRTQSSSRWNPTKEQISMLESLYKQGIRTPSAEQIQEITASLRAYGHIEGKNVFYWFQNHKARQRQKQKQETIAYINHFLHGSQPIFSSPLCPNALCSPIYLPQSEIGFDPQHSKVLPQGGIRRSPTEIFMPMPRNCDGPQVYEHVQHRIPENYINSTNQETLALFPLHPTGILESKTMDQVSSLASVSADDSTTTPSDFSDIDEEDDRPGNQPFFDFFFVRTRAPRD